ncbi:DUF982 domain-containing protein (plasmid) [Rhizobium grahamii]|uniref:DUF982 domain-containing protein n=1 Tax=Rhizobium grahamii TaxID=1120045 RepID=A0A5Q0CBJ9_9HYPH|nr:MULTISPECIES: DUF982 domain-containing protein [Rhizobium]QFY62803.1 DUF982 domain-containing protein [Rhizobium grahamii]QRM52450.1 DUF982 domain-containing protein [Rhizobium sp. BG6]
MNQERVEFSEFILWEVPVFIRIGSGVRETIDGPREALEHLLNRWPAERGQQYESAKAACRLSVQHYGSLEEARDSFLSAAREAGVLA